MLSSSIVLWSIGTILLLLPCWSAAQPAISFPTIVEVDLMFPRNDTYAPNPLMPVVFAIQQSVIAKSLNIGLLWDLGRLDASDNTTSSGYKIYGNPINSQNSTINDTPLYEYDIMYNMTIIEGTWWFRWILSTENCSMFLANGSQLPNHDLWNTLIFTTKNGAKQPDLVDTTAGNDICASAESFTFNVTGLSHEGNGSATCAVLASSAASPAPNPCAAQMNSAYASSVSAAITRDACGLPTPIVSCPPAKNEGMKTMLFGGAVWITGALAWLMHGTL
ncbi:hypothetical protein BT63DRAFT_77657 [Microthyrium microscopicum]|uniref:DUF7136 domain-containing protein n=1 Tax=Microthyrium microscopicum TaxID=703497 RepID=A0A6A6TXM8_9PEZI|nr:hypothetical protein BT63DRAFT_77657 [Microthyrium microscopicum]